VVLRNFQLKDGRLMKQLYATDVTDEQWALVAPLIPPAKHGGAQGQRALLGNLGNLARLAP